MNEWLLCIYRLNIDDSYMLTMGNQNSQPIFVIIFDYFEYYRTMCNQIVPISEVRLYS